MIIVTGSVEASSDTVEELLAISLEHVRRSREEPGCISHAVHRDVEDPLRLVFLERWADLAALHRHFAVPDSGGFVRRAAALSRTPAVLEIWDSTPVG